MNFNKVNWNFLNWSGNILFNINSISSIYASVTQTHREPTRTDMFGGEENLTEVVTTQAESVNDYELGYNITHNRLTGNVNLYYMDFSNELILNGEMGTNGLPLRGNVKKSYRTGVELSFTYELLKELILNNTTSYSINKVKTDSETLIHTMSPSWLINQSVIYGTKNFKFSIDMKYRSKMYFDLTNLYELDSSLRFGTNISYKYKDVTFGMHINNILNERSFSNGMMGAIEPLYFIDAPRNFLIDMRWKF